MTRTKTTKETLESIGFEIIQDFNTLMRKKLLGFDLIFDLENNNVFIKKAFETTISLPRKFTYIDEVTTLLTGLTGKTQFRK